MLKTLVKVGSVSNLSDARYCAGMGVSLIGYDFNTTSPHYVTPLQSKEISGWLSGVEAVGECHGMSVSEIKTILTQYEINYIETDLFDEALRNLGIPLIYRVFWQETTGFDGLLDIGKILSENSSYFHYVLLESDAKKLTPETEKLVYSLAERFPLLLGFGVTADTIEKLLQESNIQGIALRSNTEEKTGYTNANDLADLLELMEED
jgi:phosphoribosylanthranilate isomerase